MAPDTLLAGRESFEGQIQDAWSRSWGWRELRFSHVRRGGPTGWGGAAGAQILGGL